MPWGVKKKPDKNWENLLRSTWLTDFGKNMILCDFHFLLCFAQIAKWMSHCGWLVTVRTIAQE